MIRFAAGAVHSVSDCARRAARTRGVGRAWCLRSVRVRHCLVSGNGPACDGSGDRGPFPASGWRRKRVSVPADRTRAAHPAAALRGWLPTRHSDCARPPLLVIPFIGGETPDFVMRASLGPLFVLAVFAVRSGRRGCAPPPWTGTRGSGGSCALCADCNQRGGFSPAGGQRDRKFASRRSGEEPAGGGRSRDRRR